MIPRQLVAWAGLATLAAATFASAATQPTEAQLKLAQPLVAPWTGPYGGVPPFDKVRTDEIGPALEVGMDRNLAEVDLIATNPGPPTPIGSSAIVTRTWAR